MIVYVYLIYYKTSSSCIYLKFCINGILQKSPWLINWAIAAYLKKPPLFVVKKKYFIKYYAVVEQIV